MTMVHCMDRKTKFTVRPWVLSVKIDRRKSHSSSLADTSIYLPKNANQDQYY